MTFYRPGGTTRAPNRQQDFVYTDTIGDATDWLPISKGDNIAVNIARAKFTFKTIAQSLVETSPISPEAQIVLEQKVIGGAAPFVYPIDQWQNMVVATSRRAHRQGWVRLRVLNVNNRDGTGISMSLEISRTGETGAVN